MLRTFVVTLLFGAVVGCGMLTAELIRPEPGLAVRSGSSFGMCVGRCTAELTITGDQAVLVETSREPNAYPARTRSLRLSAEEAAGLAAAAAAARFDGLPTTIGCPDCADGGAEWVEVDTGGARQRVTFEYGADVRQLADLLARVRAVRARFD